MLCARSKEVEKAERAAMQLIAEQQANAVSVADVVPATTAHSNAGLVAMDVDSDQPLGGGNKRKAEDEVLPDDSKKPRMGEISCLFPFLHFLIQVLSQSKSHHSLKGDAAVVVGFCA